MLPLLLPLLLQHPALASYVFLSCDILFSARQICLWFWLAQVVSFALSPSLPLPRHPVCLFLLMTFRFFMYLEIIVFRPETLLVRSKNTSIEGTIETKRKYNLKFSILHYKSLAFLLQACSMVLQRYYLFKKTFRSRAVQIDLWLFNYSSYL